MIIKMNTKKNCIWLSSLLCQVDGDAIFPLPSSGYDNPPNVSVNASHLSAANAGTGYSAFA